MRPIALAASASLLVLAAACGANGQDTPAATAGAPVETRPANNPDQKPAFEGQTRAPGVQTAGTLRHETIASGLVHPWGLALLPGGQWLVTEKPGRMRVVSAQGQVGAPIAGLPAVSARGQVILRLSTERRTSISKEVSMPVPVISPSPCAAWPSPR